MLMKLSDQAKKELLDFCKTDDFKSFEKNIFAKNPGNKPIYRFHRVPS
jgi:hypothetical protein